jgi:Ni,Fe-hydrogenase maturation factor
MTGAGDGLVIGLGNPWRGDDGVGWRLAAAAGGCCVRQLTPDLAEKLVEPSRVLFIDGWLAPGGARRPRLRPLLPAGGGGGSHGLAPALLLTVAGDLYGVRPAAALLLVPIVACPHDRRLSPALRWQLPAARRLLHRWQAAGPCMS